MTVRPMTPDDLDLVLSWASSEGWNPGVDDASVFLNADPDGFLVKTVRGRPVAAISVVNHDANLAFLGLYICHPDFRGQGYGMEVWQAGIAHAGERCIGLDGVPAQQDNYAKSGFNRYGETVRFQGRLNPSSDLMLSRVQTPEPFVALDATYTGIARNRFSTAWFAETATRVTLSLPNTDRMREFATIRKCKEGSKIGPLYADSPQSVEAFFGGMPAEFCAGPVFIDVPNSAPDLASLVKDRGFEPVFETARMYSATPPKTDLPRFHSVATLELG